SSNQSVGTVTSHGTFAYFTAKRGGTCVVTADFGPGVNNSTGILSVYSPYESIVDDSGGADFTSIQDAITNANAGEMIYIYSGKYFESLTIDKPITLVGESKGTTIIDGDGSEYVIYVSGDDVAIEELTIQNGDYAIFCDESDSTSITHCKIKDYVYGIYSNRTTDGYIAHNKITDGNYGIVTFESYNDAVRYNTISYNTIYGAKDYNSQLKNCFNWNYFSNNHIAYYYDPDTQLAVLEFDGNTLKDNYIAIMVENASTISITNNTASKNEYGIYLLNASPNIAYNTITSSEYGIYADNTSSAISYNTISDISQYGIYVNFGDSLKIHNNTVIEAEMIFFNSTIDELWLKDSSITKINTTVENYLLTGNSTLSTGWYIRIRVVDEEGQPISNAIVLIFDAHSTIVAALFSDSDGWTEWIPVTEVFQNSTSEISYNPYRITVIKDSFTDTSVYTIDEDTTVTISLNVKEAVHMPAGSAFPWELIIVVGFIGAIGVSGIFIEIFKYGLLTLFIPLFSRIKKSEMLDQPTRYKIYGYIIGNPGAHFGLIKQDLGIPNGQLVHHIRQLKQVHLIYSTEDGIRKRFYPVDFPKPKTKEHYFTAIQEKILRIVKENSGISQKNIASSTGISRQVASYHLTKMEQIGVIIKEVEGRESRYYPSENYCAN
ncbi:MAG: right-handed parallel beta-helix repeat-containing protein, partial [Methanomassiliicoccales archaeon]